MEIKRRNINRGFTKLRVWEDAIRLVDCRKRFKMKYIERNKNINRGYRKLEIWQESILLFKLVKEKVDIVSNVSFKVKSQIEDSALSISSNIAEGYCRRHLKENIQFNNIALGSLGENYTQIYSLFSVGLIDEEWCNNYDNLHYSLEKKLIRFNKSQISMLKNKDDWKNDYYIKDMIFDYSNDD